MTSSKVVKAFMGVSGPDIVTYDIFTDGQKTFMLK